MTVKKFFTYILLTISNRLYCGYTDNLDKRFQQHLSGKASKFTRANKPVKYVYTKEYLTKSEAMKKECRIKKLTRRQKEELIQAYKIILNNL
jgi:putative endonuclease